MDTIKSFKKACSRRLKEIEKKQKKHMSLSDVDRKLENLDLEPILNDKVRVVKWLYNNSNKLTRVYEEKLVRLIVHKLNQRIKELEQSNERILNTTFRDGY